MKKLIQGCRCFFNLSHKWQYKDGQQRICENCKRWALKVPGKKEKWINY